MFSGIQKFRKFTVIPFMIPHDLAHFFSDIGALTNCVLKAICQDSYLISAMVMGKTGSCKCNKKEQISLHINTV